MQNFVSSIAKANIGLVSQMCCDNAIKKGYIKVTSLLSSLPFDERCSYEKLTEISNYLEINLSR